MILLGCEGLDETEYCAFFCRNYCPFSFHSITFFLEVEKKWERESNGDKKNARGSVSSNLLNLWVRVVSYQMLFCSKKIVLKLSGIKNIVVKLALRIVLHQILLIIDIVLV